jgi:hypothetical protein
VKATPQLSRYPAFGYIPSPYWTGRRRRAAFRSRRVAYWRSLAPTKGQPEAATGGWYGLL